MLRRRLILSAWQPARLAAEAAAFRQRAAQHGVRHGVLWVRPRPGAPPVITTAGDTAPDTVFLLASITKPMTATAVMQLAARRQCRLEDPIVRYFPAFQGGGRERITLRHALTHTSGLPDMLPENDGLRRRHAPLAEFVQASLRTPLLFAPGAECRYQSMGILLAAAVVEKITQTPLRDYLRRELFAPLGMKQASLGLGGRTIRSTALSQVSGNDDWNWNSPYWRDLGAPWGGAHSDADGVARFLTAFLEPDGKLLPADLARAMVKDQNPTLAKAWGIGWAVNARRAGAPFGAGCSARAFGHGGSTGTLCWADAETQAVCVLLTSKPAAESGQPVLHPTSDGVSRSLPSR
jgi:beta-lactamase class C